MGFYDGKGIWRNAGDGFYDAKGNWVNPGEGFYDYQGCYRSCGEGFYDAKGNWVSPGSTFYDSKGYRRQWEHGSVTASEAGISTRTDGMAVVGFMLFLPIAVLWMGTTFLIEWVTSHIYLVFGGYIMLDAIICFFLTKGKKKQIINFLMSFMGNFLCILSFVYITLIYSVPIIAADGGSFFAFFEFTLRIAFGIGFIAVLQFFNYYHGKAALELILGMIFFVLVIVLIKNNVSKTLTIESLAQIYHVKVSFWFKMIFGFAV